MVLMLRLFVLEVQIKNKKQDIIRWIFFWLSQHRDEEGIYQELMKNENDIKKNINQRNDQGNTLFMLNVSRQYNKSALYLLRNGANPNIRNYSNSHPLLWIFIDENKELFYELHKRNQLEFVEGLLKYIKDENMLKIYLQKLTMDQIKIYLNEYENTSIVYALGETVYKNLQVFYLEKKLENHLENKDILNIKKI